MFGWLFRNDNRSQNSRNDVDIQNQRDKDFATRYAICYERMMNESDPQKQSIMNCRLALGNTDFDDL